MALGDSFELGVALKLKNNQFNSGQIQTSQLAAAVSAGACQRIQNSSGVYPDICEILQHGDSILLGPSSNPTDKGQRESVIVDGIDWNSQYIYLKHRTLQYSYEAGDPITFYGTGLAGGWIASSEKGSDGVTRLVKPLGIKKGPVSRHQSVAMAVGTAVGEVQRITTGTGIYIQGAFKEGGNANWNHGFGLSILNSSDFRYMLAPVTTIGGKVYFQAAVGSSAITLYNLLLGDKHKGGLRKDSAQRLDFHVLSNAVPSTEVWIQALKQRLLTQGSSTTYGLSGLLIPYQYYRYGGRSFIDTSFITGGESVYGWDDDEESGGFLIGFNLRPNYLSQPLDGSENNPYSNFGAVLNQWVDWKISPFLLKSGVALDSPAEFEIYYAQKWFVSDAGMVSLYIDELWAEHSGGVAYSEADGCLKFSRYRTWPTESSIEINRVPDTKSKNLYVECYKTQLKCKFEHVYQELWDQLMILETWQNRGFSINLHSYLPEIPYVLTGKFKISDIKKDSWDINTRSFTFQFEED